MRVFQREMVFQRGKMYTDAGAPVVLLPEVFSNQIKVLAKMT